MKKLEPFRFECIRKSGADLTETEIDEAEARFARLLDLLAEVAAGDNRFDKSALAPHDSSPPPTGV